MKKSCLLLFTVLCVNSLHAQKRSWGIVEEDVACCRKNSPTTGISACKTPEGAIHITFSLKNNCSNTPSGSREILAQREVIGFESAANNGAVTKTWDAQEALQATRIGNQRFEVQIPNPTAYYGLSAGTPVKNIQFVFNDGPANPQAAWEAVGEAAGATGDCKPFAVVVSRLELCSAQPNPNEASFALAPNPAKNATVLFLNNPNEAAFDLMLIDATGRVVRQQKVSGATVELTDLRTGLYFVALRDEKGTILTEKLAVE